MDQAFARSRRWVLLAVVALGLGGSTAAAQATAAPMIRPVIAVTVQNSDVIITIAAGSNDGVQKDWKVWLMRGNSQNPLPRGEVEVIRVDKRVTVGKVHLTPDELAVHRRAQLSP